MKRLKWGAEVLRPVILGILLGGLGTAQLLSWSAEQAETEPPAAEAKTWPPREFYRWCDWRYLKVDEGGWTTGPVGTFEKLDAFLERASASETELCIPLFPTVYAPSVEDKIYYDAILDSDIEPGDKVLVIGTGSGADAWVAWLKSRDTIYVVEINPMAVVNARVTAYLADFPIEPIVGDVTQIDLPDHFRDFDVVLWNMPYVDRRGELEKRDFHDGDDGQILRGFLDMLPSLLKKGGTAIVLNDPAAEPLIVPPGVATKSDQFCTLFVIPNP